MENLYSKKLPGIKLAGQTVYSKALVLFVALSFLLGLAVVSLSQFVILRGFREAEEREMSQSVRRIAPLLDQQLDDLASKLAEWTSSEELIRLGAPYESAAERLSRLELELAAVVGANGELITSAVDPQAANWASAEVIARLALSVATETKTTQGKGFFLAQGRLVEVSWAPAAPRFPAGSLAFASRTLDAATLSSLGGLLSGTVEFRPLTSRNLGGPGTEQLVTLLAGAEATVNGGSGTLLGSFLIRGIDGSVLGVFELLKPRWLEPQGVVAVRVFLTILALAGGVLFVVVWLLLDRTILARIRELTRQVEAAESRGFLPLRLDFRGKDELGALARRIEELAGLLDSVQQQYRAVVEDQTEIICRFDSRFSITFANEVFQRTFGVVAATSPPGLRDMLPPEAFDFLSRKFQRLYATSPIETFQHRVVLATGEQRWLRSTLRRNFHADGTCVGGQWVAADVTLQVEAERGIQESERQLRQLSGRLLHLQDEERRRIARELHDSTAQSLSALEMNVSLIEPMAHDARSRRIVAETRRIAQDCCQELRNISYLLHPPLLDEVGLAFAIRWFADGFSERTGIEVLLEVDPDFPRLDSEVETSLFRVVQEATANIYKHSGADSARITLSMLDGVFLEISDNGKGFPPDSTPSDGSTGTPPPRLGIGMAGMRERLRQFEGELVIDNSPKGVTISIKLPARYAAAQRKENSHIDS
ncbi:MAG: hypothetical protein Fur0032_09200 [Terrimicrobiaceae bacterium]